ncbi:hypothetical protein P5673_029966 [Acropora cervicornis]|uniref:Uncharacterized protein n=1 Tax=Acropora cervicornis TaxID=6130 RepID=A0AAD9PUV8_ACRCE|nr:hypothetical protein P5673_029966 [Acropora cervicornis]
MRKEEASSGISPKALTATEEILEEITELMANKQNIEEDEDSKIRAERSQALDARFKALHTWSKTKKAEKRKHDSDENLSDDEQLTPKKSRKKRRGSDAIKFLQEQNEKEEERKQEEMEHRKDMAAIEMKRQDLLQQQLQMQQQQMQQMQTIVSKMSQP